MYRKLIRASRNVSRFNQLFVGGNLMDLVDEMFAIAYYVYHIYYAIVYYAETTLTNFFWKKKKALGINLRFAKRFSMGP